MQQEEQRRWQGYTHGTPFMQRTLVWLFKVTPLVAIYCLMALVVPFYMLLNHKEYLAIYHFFRRRMGKGALASVWHVYLNHFAFGQVVLDRFASFAGRTFKVTVTGNEHFLRLCDEPGGVLMLSSHVGCFEMSGYSLHTDKKLLYALVYAGESEVVNQGRANRFAHCGVVTVPVRGDLSHLFVLNNALDEGQVVTMPADRILGSSKSVRCRFMGAEAAFPMGPFATAVQKEVPVLAVMVVKVGLRHYEAHVTPLETDAAVGRRDRAKALAQRYAEVLEDEVRQHPHQWYNFFEYWDGAIA